MKTISFILVLFTLFFHLMMGIFGNENRFLRGYDLGGYVAQEEVKPITTETFLSSTFQSSYERGFKQSLNLFPFHVRLNNQLKFSLFGEMNNGIIAGKDGYLFEPAYQISMMGGNYIGIDSIRNQAEKLHRIIAHNTENGGPLILPVFAINKNLLIPEKLYDDQQPLTSARTNYKDYLEIFDSLGIEYIDFQSHFKEVKQSIPHPVTTKSGVHWSTYGALKAGDSLQHKIGRMLNKDVGRIYFDSITATDIPRHTDTDIAESLNLLQPITSDTYYYPEMYFRGDSSEHKPEVLLIGDSFCWTLWYQYLPHEYWDPDSHFLYYNRQMWQVTPDERHGDSLFGEDKARLMEGVEVVILLYSTMNLNDFGNGFIDEYSERVFPHH